MKRTIFLTFAFIIVSIYIFGQGAGNWAYQSKAGKSDYSISLNDEMDLGGLSNTNSYYQQAYYPTPTSINDTVIYIDVKALMNAKADTYIMILGLSQISENLETCFDLTDQRVAAFLSEAGIKEEDVYVDFISQTPIFAREKAKKIFSKKYVEIPKGFEIKKNIHIRYTDRKMADKYLKLAAKNEIYDIIRVDYIVSNHKAIYDTLRGECVSLLSKYLADFAKLGYTFEADYKSLEESNSCTYPNSNYASFSSYMPSNYQPLVGNDAEVTLVNPNESINIFYNKLPYNNYDIIINPDMIEPSVQFSQYLKLKIVLKKK
jgi:regulator of sigma D